VYFDVFDGPRLPSVKGGDRILRVAAAGHHDNLRELVKDHVNDGAGGTDVGEHGGSSERV